MELGRSYCIGAYQGLASPLGAWPKALHAARRAVAADPSLAEAHGLLGLIQGSYEYDWTAAKASMQKGLALNPDSSKVHYWYAGVHLVAGSLEDALAEFEKARETDPLSTLVLLALSRGYNQAGRYDLSEERSRQALEIAPNLRVALSNLGETYSHQGRHKVAIELLEKAHFQTAGGYFPADTLGKAYVRAGRRQDAERLLAELLGKRREGGYVAGVAIATIAAALDQYDLAFEWLDTAVTERDPNLLWNIKTDPGLATIKSDPRYQAILGRMNLAG
jgi:tetratricopeptide (TPR) repeat protein